MLLNMVMLMY